jgi:hypothetical protein
MYIYERVNFVFQMYYNWTFIYVIFTKTFTCFPSECVLILVPCKTYRVSLYFWINTALVWSILSFQCLFCYLSTQYEIANNCPCFNYKCYCNKYFTFIPSTLLLMLIISALSTSGDWGLVMELLKKFVNVQIIMYQILMLSGIQDIHYKSKSCKQFSWFLATVSFNTTQNCWKCLTSREEGQQILLVR